MSRGGPWPGRLARLAALAVAAWLGGSGLFAYRMTRRPNGPFEEPTLDVGRIESLRLATADGQDLGAWFLEGDPDGQTVVLAHGIESSRSQLADLALTLARRGVSVVVPTLRGHGDSSGDATSFGYEARLDVAAAVGWAGARRPGRPIRVHGISLGAAAALLAAGDLGDRVAGYWLEMPYTDLKTATANRTEMLLPPGLDRLAYLGIRLVGPAFLPVAIEEISPLAAAGDLPPGAPVYFVAASRDRRAKLEQIRQLADAAAGRVRFVVFEGARHQKLRAFDAEFYERTLDEWLAE